MKKTLWSAIALLVISLVTYSMKYIFNVFLARHFTPSIYGDIIVAIKTLNIFSALSLLGTTTSAQRFLKKYLNKKNKKHAHQFVQWNIKVLIHTFSIILLLTFIAMMILLSLKLFKLDILNNLHLAVFMLWITPLSGSIILFGAYLACNDKPILAFFLRNFTKYLLLMFSFIITIYFIKKSISTTQIPFIFFLAFLFLVLIEGAILYKTMPMLKKIKLEFSQASNPPISKEWFQVSVRVIINNFTFLVLCVMDLLIVEIFSHNEHNVGYYSAVLAITGIFWVISSGLFQFIKLDVSTQIDTATGKKMLQNNFNIINLLMISISTILAITIILFSKTLLLHFGPEYYLARTALYIVLAGTLVGICCQCAVVILLYSGYEKIILNISFMELVLLIIFGIPLTIYFGIIGTAISFAISVSSKTILLIYYARKKQQLKPLILF